MGRLGQMFSRFRSARSASESPPEKLEELGEMRWVVAGLGNPGDQYHRSGHNIGFMVVDRLAGRCGAKVDRRKFKGIFGEARIGADTVILVKPQTYYNLSGECVAAILGYYKIPAERLIVVHDEIDLEPRQLRLKRGGGDAGNRGVRSIAATLGTPEFVRMRVGIGRPKPGLEAKDHVLHAMGRAELEAFEASIARAAEAVESVITSGLERAMNLHNQRA
ncbi:MAG: aminoacyl-tRNA hydrolase [Candidatus Binataceae bacterium]